MQSSLYHNHNRLKELKAFSLVEVVIALAVFAVAFLMIIGVLPVGLSAARSANNLTLQAQIVKQVISTLQQAPYTNVIAPANASFSTNFSRQGDAPSPSNPTYFTVTGTVVPFTSAAALLPSTNPAPTTAMTSSTNMALVQLTVTTADQTTNYYSTVVSNLGSQ